MVIFMAHGVSEVKMLEFLKNNIGNIIIIAVLALVVFLIIRKLVKAKKQGQSSCGCGCGCGSCPMSDDCHGTQDGKSKTESGGKKTGN